MVFGEIMIVFTSIVNILVTLIYFIWGLEFPLIIILLWFLLIKGGVCLLLDFFVEEDYKDFYCYVDFFTGLTVLLRDFNFLKTYFTGIMILSFIKGTYYLIKEELLED